MIANTECDGSNQGPIAAVRNRFPVKDIHPLAEIFPWPSREQFEELVKDIKTNGQRHPILVMDGVIVDGKTRELACFVAGIEPTYEEWHGGGSVASLVFSLNMARRHLSESQRALLAAKLVPQIQKEIAADSKKITPNAQVSEAVKTTNCANLRGTRKKAIQKAAESANVSPRSVEHAVRVLEHATPEQVHLIENGEAAVSAIAKEVRLEDSQSNERPCGNPLHQRDEGARPSFSFCEKPTPERTPKMSELASIVAPDEEAVPWQEDFPFTSEEAESLLWDYKLRLEPLEIQLEDFKRAIASLRKSARDWELSVRQLANGKPPLYLITKKCGVAPVYEEEAAQ